MTNPGTHGSGAPLEAPMLGDHLAMDLLNTQAKDTGEVRDYWNSGDDVLAWLARHKVIPAPSAGPSVDRAALLAQAKALRALARRLISQQKEGVAGDLGGLNEYLHAYRSAPQLVRDAGGHLAMTRIASEESVASLLGPVAVAVAELLAEGDFSLVKRCEHPDCVLWFYDRTKAHKRRWCSMALCGNRHKAAQFRKRSRGDAA